MPGTAQSVTQLAENRINKKSNRWKLLLILFLSPLIILFLTGLAIWLWNQSTLTAELTRKTNALWYWSDEPVLVGLYPTVSKYETPVDVKTKAKVIFALDISLSMGSKSAQGDMLFESLKVIKLLSRMLVASGVDVGFIEFNSSANLSAPLGSTIKELEKTWGNISEGGGTDISSAINLGISNLEKEGASGDKKLLVIVSDGGDNSIDGTLRLAEEAKQKDITLAGIGIGGANQSYFENAYPAPEHFSTCCDNNHEHLVRFLSEILTHSDILEFSGENVRLTEYPHFSALPLDEDNNEDIENAGIPYSFHSKGKLDFILFYFLDTPHFYSYLLKADALGVHPVAEAPAVLSYVDKSGQNQQQISGDSIAILVISPWLLFWMFFPALLYALFMLLTRKPQIKIQEPKDLPVLARRSILPDLPRHRFKRHSLLPISENNDELIPTLAIAIGPKAGSILAALIHNRKEAGVSGIDKFLPMYFDCRRLKEDEYPEYMDSQLDVTMTYCLKNEDKSVSSLIQEINTHPHKHHSAKWFNSAKYQGKTPDVDNGCGGDRMLARLVLYNDLCSAQPKLHQFREKLKKWCQENTDGQIFVIASGFEDLGSGWLVDIGFHIRTALQSQTFPCYAFLDTDSSVSFSQQENYEALKIELQTIQAGVGWPYHCMDLVDGEISDNSSVLLPLFDRVISLEHESIAAHSGLSGAALLELCDVQVKEKIHADMAATVAKARVATQHRENEFLTLIDASILSLPITAWKKRWALWALNDALQTIVSYEQKDNRVSLIDPAGNQISTDEVWQEIKAVKFNPSLQTTALWDFVNQSTTDLPVKQFDESLYHRELITMVVYYLNAFLPYEIPNDLVTLKANRVGRYKRVIDLLITWQNRLNKTKKESQNSATYDAPQRALDTVLKHLYQWSEALLVTEGGQEQGVMQQLSNELNTLEQADPASARGAGRVMIDTEHWYLNLKQHYESHIRDKIINSGDLPFRLQWVASADGTQLELNLISVNNQRYTINDIKLGRLQKNILSLMENNLTPEMQRWSLDEFLSVDKLNSFLQSFHIKDKASTFVFHGFQEQKNSDGIKSLSIMADPEISPHSYNDRIAFLSVDENFGLDVISEIAPKAVQLPLIQNNSIVVRNLYNSQQGFRADTNFSAVSKMLAQDLTYLDTALIILANQNLVKQVDNVFIQYFLKISEKRVPVTLLGDDSIENAIKQVILRKVDIEGNPIDFKSIQGAWQLYDLSKKTELLEKFIVDNEKKAILQDWEILLLMKAQIDMQNKGGVLV